MVFVALALVLTALLMLRLRMQAQATLGPSGGSGTVEATRISVAPKYGGRVLEILVHEGQNVAAGTVAARLDCTEPRARLAELEARIGAAEAQVQAARAQVRIAQGSRGAAAAMANVSVAQDEVLDTQRASAERELQRVVNLGDAVPTQRRDQAQDLRETLARQHDAVVAQQRASRAQVSIASAQGQAAIAALQGAEAALQAVQASRAIAALAVDECDVKVPQAGIVEAIDYEVGELATPGAAVVRLIQLDVVEATFYLPNAELSAVTRAQRANVIADAWPGLEFVGTVTTIASAAEFTPRTVQTRTDRDRLVYPVTVSIPNPRHQLRPGMPVQVALVTAAPAAR